MVLIDLSTGQKVSSWELWWMVYPMNKRTLRSCWNRFWKNMLGKLNLQIWTDFCYRLNTDSALDSPNVYNPWTWDALGEALWDSVTQGNGALADFVFVVDCVQGSHGTCSTHRPAVVLPQQLHWLLPRLLLLCCHWAKYKALILYFSGLWKTKWRMAPGPLIS